MSWCDGSNDRGQALIEVALLLPMLVFLLLGGADMARALAVQLAVENAARAAAESELLSSSPSQSAAQTAAQNELSQTPGVTSSNATAAETLKTGEGATCTTSSLATPCFLTVTVTYTFNTITPWPLIPNSFTFKRSTTLRRYL